MDRKTHSVVRRAYDRTTNKDVAMKVSNSLALALPIRIPSGAARRISCMPDQRNGPLTCILLRRSNDSRMVGAHLPSRKQIIDISTYSARKVMVERELRTLSVVSARHLAKRMRG